MSQVRAWLAGVAAVCCLVGVAAGAGAASAAAPSWVSPTTLTGGDPTVAAQAIPDPAGGAMLYYSAYGIPTVRRVKPNGSLGPAQAVPPFSNLGNYGPPHQVAFLPNGAAIVTWQLSSYGTDYMAYLSPTGTWGAPVQTADAVTSIAVRAGEVLTSEAGGPGVTADDWTLSSSGKLTHKSGPISVFTGNPLFGQSWVALDNSGSATVISYGYTSSNSSEEVYQTVRSKNGVWGSSTSVSGTTGAIQNVVFAAAPGGHAVVAWQDRPSGTAPVMSAAIRVSGGGFGTADALSSPTSAYFAYAIPIVAAGSDGTLGVAVSNEIGNGPYDSSYTTTNSVWLVAAGAKTFTGPKTVTGTTDKFLINSLGAVSGAALVGIHEEKITGGKATYPSSYHATETTTAVRVPSSGASQLKNFGSTSGLYDGNGGDGCTSCAGTSPPPASVSGVALSGHGFEVAVGQLKPGGSLSYAVVAATLPPVPAVSITSKRLTASTKSVSVAVKCSKAACRGTITLTRTAQKKTVTLGSGPYSLKTGTHASITVTLTKAGRSAFKNAATKAVSATVHVTVKGGKTVTKTLRVA
jgi:hypothetical protein